MVCGIQLDESTRRTASLIIAAVREVDLPTQMLGILACLAEQPGCSTKHVAARLGIPRPSASRSTDMLVAMGLVKRDANPGDHRLVRLMLTERGEALLRHIDDAGTGST